MRWVGRLEEVAAEGRAAPVVWLVRPDSAAAASALRAVRPRAEDLADAARWRDPDRGAERLTRRLLLRALAAAVLDAGADAVVVAREAGGRPRVTAPRPLHASVARREGWAALALCTRPVGVDLEAAEPASPLPLVLLGAAERAQVEAGTDPAEQARRFARAWAAREAYLKASGAGLATLARISVALSPAGGAEVDGPQGRVAAHMRSVGDLIACTVVLG